MSLVKRLDPREGIVDFWHEFRRPNPYRWPILGISVLMTGTLLFVFTLEKAYIEPARPEVEFITTFPEGRSDEEIVASNIANQEFQDVVEEQTAQKEERKREMFRTLGRVSGMDVDEIERMAAEERANEEAAEAALREQARARAGAANRAEPTP